MHNQPPLVTPAILSPVLGPCAIGLLACLDGPSAREISRKTRRGEQISNMGWRSGGVFRPCRPPIAPRNPMKNPANWSRAKIRQVRLWRTHSCVQRSHSCERFLLQSVCETEPTLSAATALVVFRPCRAPIAPRNPMKSQMPEVGQAVPPASRPESRRRSFYPPAGPQSSSRFYAIAANPPHPTPKAPPHDS
jgi:hypothetical protein